MGLQESFSRAEDSVPFGFVKPKRKRTLPVITNNVIPIKGRGFRGMDRGKRLKAQRKGGHNAHKNPKGLRCCEFTSTTGRNAALKRWGKL